MAQDTLPDFTNVARFSDKENWVYEKLFNKFAVHHRLDGSHLPTMIGDAGLKEPELAKIWKTVCAGSMASTLMQFKMICKYICLKEHFGNYQAHHFETPGEPFTFKEEPYRTIYLEAIQEFSTDVTGSTATPTKQSLGLDQSAAWMMQSSQKSISQSQPSLSGMNTPHKAGSMTPGLIQPVSCADFGTASTSWQHFTSEDLLNFETAVSKLRSAVPGFYTNTELAEVIRSFQLPEKKDLTAIWKMVDFNNTRALSLEGSPQCDPRCHHPLLVLGTRFQAG